MGADTFVAFEAGELSGADVILLDKGVLGDSPLLHGFPQIVVGNHRNRPLFT